MLILMTIITYTINVYRFVWPAPVFGLFTYALILKYFTSSLVFFVWHYIRRFKSYCVFLLY